MYKPNGEEPMTKAEEQRRREAVAARIAEREVTDPSAESLRSAFYAAVARTQSSRAESVLLCREG